MKKSIAKKSSEQCLKACKEDRVYVGLDVHKRSIAVRVNGGLARASVLPARSKAVLGFLKEARDGVRLIVYEAGPTGFGLARSLRKAGFAVEA